jgi:hypothetical protein
VPRGQYDLAFKVAFGGAGAAARFLRVSRMTIWRWSHDRAPLPRPVAEVLDQLVHIKVTESHQAEQELRWFLQRPDPPPRPLSGCCTGYVRKSDVPRF